MYSTSISLPFCETLHLGVNDHGLQRASLLRQQQKQKSERRALQKFQQKKNHLPIVSDIRDQLPPRSFFTHLIVNRKMKQQLILQSVNLDAEDLMQFYTSSSSSCQDDFTVTLYCQRSSSSTLLEQQQGEKPIALCTLKPSAGIVSVSFPREEMKIQFETSTTFFAIVRRTINVKTTCPLSGEDKNGNRRRQRNENAIEEEEQQQQPFRFKLHLLGFISQKIDKLSSLDAWRRISNIVAGHSVLENNLSAQEAIFDDFETVRDLLQRKLHNQQEQNEDDDDSSDDDDASDSIPSLESFDSSILNSSSDGNDEHSNNEDDEEEEEDTTSNTSSRHHHHDGELSSSQNEDEQSNSEDDEDEEEFDEENLDDFVDDEEATDEDDEEGDEFDHDGGDDEDDDDGNESDDYYYNEGPQQTWRYGYRR